MLFTIFHGEYPHKITTFGISQVPRSTTTTPPSLTSSSMPLRTGAKCRDRPDQVLEIWTNIIAPGIIHMYIRIYIYIYRYHSSAIRPNNTINFHGKFHDLYQIDVIWNVKNSNRKIHTKFTIKIIYPIGSMVLPYMVTWIPSIYPSHVSIYTSTMDPMRMIISYRIVMKIHMKILWQWHQRLRASSPMAVAWPSPWKDEKPFASEMMRSSCRGDVLKGPTTWGKWIVNIPSGYD